MPDNQVLIGGQPVGSVESIGLTDDNLAEVKISVEQELHEGTTAVIRATSLSGRRQPLRLDQPRAPTTTRRSKKARRSASPRPPPRPTSTSSSTPSRRRSAAASPTSSRAAPRVYAGRGPDANKAFKYFGPGSQPHQRLRPRTQRRRAPLRTLPGQLEQARRPRLRPQRPALQRDLQRQHRLRRDRQPERRLRPDPAARCRRSSARPTRPSSTCAPPSTTSTRWSKRRSRRPRTWPRSSANCARSSQKAVPVFKNLRLTVSRPGNGQRRRRTAGGPARRPAARLEGLPARRRRDRRLPAQPQLRPRLHARHLQRLRQARPGHRPLRRQRPLRPRLSFSDLNLFNYNARRTGTDRTSRTVRRLRRLGRRQAPLPRRRHPARRRRLQPLRRTAVRGLRRDHVRVQPRRRAPRTMRNRKD